MKSKTKALFAWFIFSFTSGAVVLLPTFALPSLDMLIHVAYVLLFMICVILAALLKVNVRICWGRWMPRWVAQEASLGVVAMARK